MTIEILSIHELQGRDMSDMDQYLTGGPEVIEKEIARGKKYYFFIFEEHKKGTRAAYRNHLIIPLKPEKLLMIKLKIFETCAELFEFIKS